MIGGLPIRQVAYFVEDVRAAAIAHAATFGSGPYFVADHIPLKRSLHRGVAAPLDHSSAYGQWNDLMIEFVQQNNPGSSAFRDMFAPEGEGFHHVALIVDDLDTARAACEQAGFTNALEAEMNDGFRFLMMDAVARYGHMIELYEGAPVLTGFYDVVRQASVDFDGRDVIRAITMT
ncbi:VOC family protein [Sphingobium sp. WCS2017Hpa-17]|uniref:VOC family protein n=1 Tax=Sphingobium sp. WCS2017Hpa-17 TaxID=3073638 RepID=UPI00288BA91D|nr:VOC family protein [Sphingobium sp. WCS2017Hpa-17]